MGSVHEVIVWSYRPTEQYEHRDTPVLYCVAHHTGAHFDLQTTASSLFLLKERVDSCAWTTYEHSRCPVEVFFRDNENALLIAEELDEPAGELAQDCHISIPVD